MKRGAAIDGEFRYWLWRDWSGRQHEYDAWGPLKFGVLWVMLNPSTADHQADDPTIRKCIGFTKRLGHESFAVTNLFALRSKDPEALRTAHLLNQDIIGPRNDSLIAMFAERASVIICAWGAYAGLGNEMGIRIRELRKLLEGGTAPRLALGFTKAGAPRHPLMMPYYAATELKPWPPSPDAHTPRPEGLTVGAEAQLRTSTHPEQASAVGDNPRFQALQKKSRSMAGLSREEGAEFDAFLRAAASRGSP